MSYIVPALIFALIVWALIKKVDLYASFVKGASEALPLILNILPYVATMMIALSVARNTGALDAIVNFIAPGFEAVGMDKAIVPLFVLRPFSGNGALALLNDVFRTAGVDSVTGMAASNMLGSTETIFYTIALYFGSVKINKTRHSIPVALISGAVGAAAAIILTPFFM